MTIDATAIGMTPHDRILLDMVGVRITLELTTMKGEAIKVKANDDFDAIPDRPPTLADLVAFVMRRQHPVFDYVAERNGIRVIEYKERPSFRQAMSAIEYDPETKTLYV